MNKIEYFNNNPMLIGFIFNDTNYVYNAKNNIIFELANDSYNLIKEIDKCENISNLTTDNKNEVFNLGILDKVSANEDEIEYLIDNYFENILPRKFIIEVTEECNLRCKYCFNTLENGPRKHSKRKLSFSIAQKAIDQYFNIYITAYQKIPNEKKNLILKIAPPNLSWWGGEPFLNFDLIKETYSYFKSLPWDTYSISTDKLVFSVVTNLTYLTEDITKFIINNNIYLMVSLDGDKDVHDNNRIFKNGYGSFDVAIKNISYFLKNHPIFSSSRIIIQSVYMPGGELLSNKNNFLNQYFYDNKGEKKVLKISQYPQKTGESFISKHWLNSLPTLDERLANFKNLVKKISELDDFEVYDYISHDDFVFEELKEALLCEDQLNSTIDPNMGNSFSKLFSCPIGRDVIYVSAKGEYHICNKTDSSYPIGTVESQIDKDRIKSLLCDYLSNLDDKCKKCWAVHFCKICPANLLSNSSFRKTNDIECLHLRNTVEWNLTKYIILSRNIDVYNKVKEIYFNNNCVNFLDYSYPIFINQKKYQYEKNP